MRFNSVTLALVSPVNPELIDISVQSFSITVTSGADTSDLLIKFGTLVTFCILIGSIGNAISLQTGATTFYFAYFFLSLDDALFLTGSLI